MRNGNNSSHQSNTMLPGKAERSRPLRENIAITKARAAIFVFAAERRCLIRKINLTRERVGQVSPRQPNRRPLEVETIQVMEWFGLKSPAQHATLIWDTFSMTGHYRPVNDIASIQLLWTLRKINSGGKQFKFRISNTYTPSFLKFHI